MKCFAFIFIAICVLGQSHGGVIHTTDAIESAGGDRDERQLFGLPGLFSQSGASSQNLGAELGGGLLNFGLSQSEASSSAQAGTGSGASSNSKATSVGAGIAGFNLFNLGASSSSSSAQSFSFQ